MNRTISNLDEVDIRAPSSPTPNYNADCVDLTSEENPTTSKSSFKPRKRKFSGDDELLEYLKSSGKDEDEFFHFGMSVAEKLRKWSRKKASRKQRKIALILYNSDSSDDE